MRQLLMTTLLIVTVVYIYIGVTQGSDGTKAQITGSGTRMTDHIIRMSP